MDQKLKSRKTQQLTPSPDQEKPLRFAQKIEKPPVRPPTPDIVMPREEEEEMEVAAVLLQKLIRGRVEQGVMYQGEEKSKTGGFFVIVFPA